MLEKMPEDFTIWFSYSIDPDRPNALDTSKGRIYKDLIMDGVVESYFTISEEALSEIYQKLREFEINKISKDMTSINLAKSGNIMMSPCVKYLIVFRVDDVEYTVTGDSTAFLYPEGKNLKKFCDYMTEFLQATEEYQSLPKAVGGYD